MNAFTEEIASFPPGGELLFDLAQGFVLFGEKADESVTPVRFTVSAAYAFAGTNVTEQHVVDLRPYLYSGMRQSDEVRELEELRKAAERQARSLVTIATHIGRLGKG